MTSTGKSSKSSSSSSPWKHDVFLSFRGEDTRKGFTDHLYHALDGKSIDTFRDTEGLVRGEAISPGLLKVIEESRFAVIVLSEKYASSSWCLDEVAEIVKCHRVWGQTIIPVFYHVEPNHVRNQTATFGEPFTRKHKDQDVNRVNRWREALSLVANIHPCWELKDGLHDSVVIEEIVNEIFKELYQRASKEFVGMDSRIKKIQSLLDKCQSDDVCTIGVWGMAGIGKTTVARGFYQSMYDKFEASAFIGNVREEYEKNGMVHLQKRLQKILFNDDEGIHDDHTVTNILSQRLRSKKVLIILDDVDKPKQIEDLVGSWKSHYDWLGRGSRIIVTTRDNHLVMNNYGHDYIYEVDKLNDDEALQLLHQRAFDKNRTVSDKYRDLCIQVVEYANGHPLTLEVLSPHLKGTTVDEWSNILAELKKHPDDEPFHRALQVSYNGLNKWEKKIFLDIACFFKGEDLYRVKKILDSCRFYPTIGLRVLLEKCFITIASDKLWMHDMLQEFGHEIVRQESIDMLGKRSRLWNDKDARNVVENYKGTQAVEGIFLSLPKNEELHMSEEKKMLEMRKLRILKIHNVLNFSESGYLSNELRVLEWHQYPLIYMPSSFQPKNLVELNMSNSHIERLWDHETALSLDKLILLDLSNCEYLVETPDFSRVPNLERLNLEGCKRLSAVHPTIKELKGLKLLNLKDCESLDSLPQGICFKFLEIFILSGCKKLDRFPDIVGDMNCLIHLFLEGTAIKELPTSVERLTSLKLLDLRECKNLLSLPDFICSLTSLEGLTVGGCSMINQLPENIGSLEKLEEFHACRTAVRKAPPSIVLLKNLKKLCFFRCGGVADGSLSQCSSESNIRFQLPKSFSGLSSLTVLDLTKCNLEEGSIPEDIGCLSQLERLELGGNNFMSLPDSISQLSKLRRLNVDKCRKLQSLTKLPLNVKEVKASDCAMLNDQMIIWPSDKGFSFIDSRKSVKAEGRFRHQPFPMPKEHIPTLFPKFIQDQIYHGGNFELRFPYARIPEWCSRWNKGSSLRIRLPEKDSSQTWIGFALFVVFLIKKQEKFHDGLYNTFVEFYTDEGCLENPCELESFNGFLVGSYGLCVYVPKTRFEDDQLDKASHIKASFSTNRPDLEVLKFGLHVIYDKDVAKFTQDLVDTSNEHLNLTSIKHYMHILERASELERSGNVHKLKSGSSPKRQVLETLLPTSQLKRDLQSLLSRIFFEGSLYTRNLSIYFSFPMEGFVSGWFFHQSVGRNVVCYVPANIVDDKSWIGFSLCATLKMTPSDLLKNFSVSETSRPLLHIDLHCHGSSISHIKTIDDIPIMPYSHQFFLFHTPRVFFEKDRLNECWGMSALFRTNIPNVEIERCGIQAVYEKDLTNVIEIITECQLGCADNEQLCCQVYKKLVESIIDSFQFDEPETRKQEIPIHSSYPSQREYESLQTNMFVLSTQHVDQEVSTAYEEMTIPRDPILVHSIQNFMESSYKLIEKRSSGSDSKLGLIHLQIMAETPLFEDDLTRWKSNLEAFLKHHFCVHIFITLSLKGRIISVLKPFNPFSPYNLCFPRKEILEWFGGYQVNGRTMGIGLPPNLKTDKDWRGIAVCVAFSVVEHPNAILDNDNSQVSFRVLCHMYTNEGCCLNPVPMFRITKDKFKWSCVRGFIWLTYIPSSLLVAELHGQSYIVIDIYNECPGLVTKNLGVRLLFKKDVEELRQSITKCMTGFFDNLDLVCQFMANESDKKIPSHVDLEPGSSSTENSCWYICFAPENLTAESNFLASMKLDQNIIYNSCFPPTEILNCFSNHHSSGHSVIIEIPTDLYRARNWLGVAVCAYFSSDGPQPSTCVDDDLDPEMPHNLICHFGLNSTHHFQIAVEEFEKIHIGNQFIWLSYIPRLWFSDQLKHCSFIEASFASDRQGFLAHKCGVRVLYKHDEKEFKETINQCMAIGYSIHQMKQIDGFEAEEAEIRSHAVQTEPICQIKSGRDFDRGLIYSSCFPRTEIVDWFNHHIGGPSLEIQPLSNLFGDDNWIGLALCAYFSDPEHPTTFPDKFDPDFSHYLVCVLETERVTLGPLHHHEITNQEFKKLENGEFIWLSYIPRLWFSEQLEGSFDLIKASFASDRGGWHAEKCGLRLLFGHDEEEFKQTINHCMDSEEFKQTINNCMASLIENRDPISQTKFDNEENKKQCHHGQAGTNSKSSRFVPDPQQERLEGPENLNQKDKCKRIVQ